MRARREIDRAAIEHHYDLSTDFYSLFLDRRMVYTCAYFRSPDADLDTAQADKLEHVCRKLRLRPGDTLLDVGCGWGSLAVWAAKHQGARVLGVTLSAEQDRFAQETIARDGLAERCRIECRDWRDTIGWGPFDRVAAIRIVEHVGIANYPAFFGQLHDLLRPGGLLLNHGITRSHTWRHTPQWDFVLAHVFPDGEFDKLSRTCSEIEAAGLEVLDVEGLRPHYARTCRPGASGCARTIRGRSRSSAGAPIGPGCSTSPHLGLRGLRGTLDRASPGARATTQPGERPRPGDAGRGLRAEK